ncbi:response regulator [Sphingomonas sp. NSE70-1]|uniref:histidine kinase n=1 Tax=Sphingomonas caseinilyticus TaxID=2908205 RepID=A0ABT0RRY8_9SPHN|nr:response regulator [Sphingomonas caseinilyticus]MCL6697686.1 response regulator [Sphingomonas caseinilyticus]
MLYEQLDLGEVEPLDGGFKWLVPGLVAAAAISGALLFFLIGQPIYGGLFLAGFVGMLVAAFVIDRRSAGRVEVEPIVLPDLALAGSALNLSSDPAAITDVEGALKAINIAYKDRFDGTPAPIEVGRNKAASTKLVRLKDAALRDGEGSSDIAVLGGAEARVEVSRIGIGRDLLLWRFTSESREDPLDSAANQIAGQTGERLAAAGVLAVLVDGNGRLVAANALFSDRALDGTVSTKQPPLFTDLIEPAGDGSVKLMAEGPDARPMRVVTVPIEIGHAESAATLLLFDADQGPSLASSTNVQVLLEMLPIGLALVDRDGRFLTVNKAFRQAGGIPGSDMPSYPGDLVVKEDKAAVADAVRRNARGPSMSGDLPVRLKHQPTEPVALTVAGLRGLGDAAVLLLLKDNSEEAKLKRQIAQATKMQAVGQLAGGVAHDFNNILTAIIGHCDLMLMRHTPGDTDYDDLQQIKSNSNRAAGLTRQLLAFSRQQTLRPQILQLPDVISEVSHLLKRLLGETVQLVVKHGRDLGPVRADPGQLEQVIVNLSVNARDAMATKGGGTLTIQTYSVKANQVADLGSEILPIADYSALSIADTGTGIPAAILSKVFEPFFTTKEVGKGTGLGLSTVYGIVKQSGGYIFADSKVGDGTRFTIYLPVHQVEEEKKGGRKSKKQESENELWGTGTILLVEDEPMVRTVAERALTRHGYKVLTANNGEEALEIIDRGDEIALLISDVVMPLMDGPTMVREARKTRPELPILFMSGYAEEQLRKSIDIANVAFLPKPFSVQELAEAVRKVLSGN